MTNFDPTDVDLVVNGQVISEFAGLMNWKPDQTSTPIKTPGNVRVGVNRQRGANGVDFSLKVKRTSKNIALLHALVRNQNEVPIVAAVVRNLADYEVNQEIALGCDFGVLTGGERGMGDTDEAEDVEFQVHGRGIVQVVKE